MLPNFGADELADEVIVDRIRHGEPALHEILHRAKKLLREHVDRRLGPAAGSVYQFHLSRCDRVVAGVMEEIQT